MVADGATRVLEDSITKDLQTFEVKILQQKPNIQMHVNRNPKNLKRVMLENFQVSSFNGVMRSREKNFIFIQNRPSSSEPWPVAEVWTYSHYVCIIFRIAFSFKFGFIVYRSRPYTLAIHNIWNQFSLLRPSLFNEIIWLPLPCLGKLLNWAVAWLKFWNSIPGSIRSVNIYCCTNIKLFVGNRL